MELSKKSHKNNEINNNTCTMQAIIAGAPQNPINGALISKSSKVDLI